MSDHAPQARETIAANRYMTLATADARGLPWASPVWFAAIDEREFFWISSPEARHSRNIAARPEVAIVIFDSQVAVGDARAVYLMAVAEELAGAELERGLEVFSRESLAQGLPVETLEDVIAPASHRLYRAVASEQFVLGEGDERQPVRDFTA